MLSENESELLRVVERFRICRGGGGGEVEQEVVAAAVAAAVVAVSPRPSPLSSEVLPPRWESVDWLALFTMTFLSAARPLLEARMCEVAAAAEGRSGAVSESCLEAMLPEWPTLEDKRTTAGLSVGRVSAGHFSRRCWF